MRISIGGPPIILNVLFKSIERLNSTIARGLGDTPTDIKGYIHSHMTFVAVQRKIYFFQYTMIFFVTIFIPLSFLQTAG